MTACMTRYHAFSEQGRMQGCAIGALSYRVHFQVAAPPNEMKKRRPIISSCIFQSRFKEELGN